MKYRFLIFAFVAVAIVSCNMKSAMSPTIRTNSSLYRTSAEGITDTISFTDSLSVGDTVRLRMACDGYYDYLRSVTAKADTSHVKVSLAWDEEYKEHLAADADPEHGYLSFVPDKVYGCITTLTYVVTSSGTHRIDLSVLSAAEEKYSYSSYYFFAAVK